MNISPITLLVAGLLLCGCAAGCSTESASTPAIDPAPAPTNRYPDAEPYALDLDLSKINWMGREVIGGTRHEGELRFRKGTVYVLDGEVVGAQVSVDMTYIRVMQMANEPRKKLEAHLKSDDFFAVGQYPEAHFTLTRIVRSDTVRGGNALVTGNWTIRGVTKALTVPVSLGVNDDFVTILSPEFTIDRTDWGIHYRSGLLGVAKDEAISDLITLRLRLRANSPSWMNGGPASPSGG